MFDFKDRVALITGASRGIGLQVAQDFVEGGAQVILAARSVARIEREVKALQRVGEASALVLDVTDGASIESAVKNVVEQFGKIDILVNNAGITNDGLLMRLKDEAWDQVLDTNLKGAFRMTREVVPHMMKKRYGRIVNIVSVVGLTGNPGQSNYVSSKAGLIGLTKAVAREIASRGITVNAVAPGFIETDMTADLGQRVRDQLLQNVPLKRIGEVTDVAPGIMFLASEEAGYITGHVLNINGGMYM